MQLFGTKLFSNSRIFLFVILKKVVTIDKFQLPPNSLHPNKFLRYLDSTVIALHSSAIPYSQYSWCEWRRSDCEFGYPSSAPPLSFDRFVHGCGQSTSLLLPLSRVVGVSSVGNSEIDEYQSWPTTLRPQRKQRGRNRNGEEKLEPWSMRTTACPPRCERKPLRKNPETMPFRCFSDLSFLCNYFFWQNC